MFTKTMFAIAIIVAAVGTMGIIAGAPAADAQAQSRAPGQSGCNPGHSDDPFCGPPGQGFFVNPGQCQKDLQEFFDFSKEDAHNFCHTTT